MSITDYAIFLPVPVGYAFYIEGSPFNLVCMNVMEDHFKQYYDTILNINYKPLEPNLFLIILKKLAFDKNAIFFIYVNVYCIALHMYKHILSLTLNLTLNLAKKRLC